MSLKEPTIPHAGKMETGESQAERRKEEGKAKESRKAKGIQKGGVRKGRKQEGGSNGKPKKRGRVSY